MFLYQYENCFKIISKINRKVSQIIRYFCDNYYDDTSPEESHDFIIKLFIREVEAEMKIQQINSFNLLEQILNKSTVSKQNLDLIVQHQRQIKNAEAMREMFLQQELDSLTQIAEEEFQEWMDEQKRLGIKNKRNGYRKRIVRTTYGEGKIWIPRARHGCFMPKFLIKKFKEITTLYENISTMLHLQESQSKVRKYIKELLNFNPSRELISRAFQATAEFSKFIYENQEIPEEIDVLFVDTFYTYVKYDYNPESIREINHNTGEVKYNSSPSKVSVGQFYGFSFKENKYYDLTFEISHGGESIEHYVSGFSKLQEKGLKKIGLLVADNNVSIRSALDLVYPDCKVYQQCFTHFGREILKQCVGKNNKEVMGNILELILQEHDKIQCKKLIDKEIKKLTCKPAVAQKLHIKILENLDSLTAYKQFPKIHWRKIYTSNYIESQNKVVKQMGNLKSCSYDTTTLEKYLYICKSKKCKLNLKSSN